VVSEAFSILTDGAHVLSELFWEVSFLLVGMGLARWQARREHRKHHEETERPAAPAPDWKQSLQPPVRRFPCCKAPMTGWHTTACQWKNDPFFVLGLDPDESIPFTLVDR
jgi:hypothetical protein